MSPVLFSESHLFLLFTCTRCDASFLCIESKLFFQIIDHVEEISFFIFVLAFSWESINVPLQKVFAFFTYMFPRDMDFSLQLPISLTQKRVEMYVNLPCGRSYKMCWHSSPAFPLLGHLHPDSAKITYSCSSFSHMAECST